MLFVGGLTLGKRAPTTWKGEERMNRFLAKLAKALVVSAGLSIPLSALLYAAQIGRPDIAVFTVAELVVVALLLAGIRRARRARTGATPS